MKHSKKILRQFRLFLALKLPLAYLAGVRLDHLNNKRCVTKLKFRWINQNPFGSMYFAAQQMAAELSTGLLLYQHFLDEPNFLMLLKDCDSNYLKQAKGRIRFECNHGEEALSKIQEAQYIEENIDLKMSVLAYDSDNEIVSEFNFNWSLKKRPRG